MVSFQLQGLVDYPDEDSDDENVLEEAARSEEQPPAKKLRVSL
jgi:hypothetical protein